MTSWYTLGLTSLNNAVKEPQLDLHALALAISERKIKLHTPLPEDEPVKLYCVDSEGNYISVEESVWRVVGPRRGTTVFVLDELTSRHVADQLILNIATDGQLKALQSSLPVKWVGLIDDGRAESLASIQKLVSLKWRKETKFAIEMLSCMEERTEYPASATGALIVDRDCLNATVGDLMVKAAELQTFSTATDTDNENFEKPSNSCPGHGSGMAPHWGEGLRTIINVANHLWGPHSVNPNDEDTFPANTDVIAEFESKGFNNRIAKELAKAIRPDWGKVVLRKKS